MIVRSKNKIKIIEKKNFHTDRDFFLCLWREKYGIILSPTKTPNKKINDAIKNINNKIIFS